MKRVLLFIIVVILCIISIQLNIMYDYIIHDYKAISQCINNIKLDCPVEKGATIIINEGGQHAIHSNNIP